jgi:hypothetical protein
MSDQICDELIQAVEKQGVSQVEVTRGKSNDFTMRSLTRSPMAQCTVTLLDHQPKFRVNFDLADPALSGVTFSVSESDAVLVAHSASRVFPNLDDAAQWLVKILAIPAQGGTG